MLQPTGASGDVTNKRHVGPDGILGQEEGVREELRKCD